MWKQAISAVMMVMLLTAITGLIYPLAMTGLALALFPDQANGSMIRVDGKTVGSVLIGQNFTKPEYFQGRPSAAGQDGYDAASSSGSNLGPTNQKLIDAAKERLEGIRSANGLETSQKIPADAVLTSASGLDPHITPDYAYLQAERIAKARGLRIEAVQSLIGSQVEGRQFGFLGEMRVNVLKLNLTLDTLNR